jgi:class 3 adenylate cyclase
MTDELRLTNGSPAQMVPVPLGSHIFGSEYVDVAIGWPGGWWTIESMAEFLSALGPWVLADLGGDQERMRELVDPRISTVLDELNPAESMTALTFALRYSTTPQTGMGAGAPFYVKQSLVRIHDEQGEFVGVMGQMTTAVGMSTIGAVAALGDLGHFERMQRVAKAARRPAAILFADLEGSSALARRLPTARYFTLGRRLVRAADQCIIDSGGLVGRHVGDGVVAFFLADLAGSESAAARGCIAAACALRASAAEIAVRSGLQPEDLVLRFGLHWGSNPYVGNISTVGRSEVTALGEEVNVAARIEACARGGMMLASKDLVELLDPESAAALDLDLHQVDYTPLGELPTATPAARRDAPTIPVCQL